jgi:hypothetical protein
LLSDRYKLAVRKLGLRNDRDVPLRTDLFKPLRPERPQMELGF